MKTRLLILIAPAVVLGSGCSGINVSKSVSPLDFLVPGLMYNTPSTPPLPGETNSAPLLAGSPNHLLLSEPAFSTTAEPQD